MNDDGRPKGFAHVEFESNADAVAALKFAGQELDGRELRMDLSQPRRGGGGGGFRGGDRRGGGGFRGGDRDRRGGGGFRGGDRDRRGGGGFRGGDRRN